MSLRKRVNEIVNAAHNGDRISHIFDISIMALVVINVIAVILETVPSIEARYGALFTSVELISVAIFTVEYLLRLWCCVEEERFAHPIKGRLRYMFSFMALVDLLAILPFYFRVSKVDLRVIRLLRLTRIMRIIKLGRYYQSFKQIKRVFSDKREELTITMVTMFFLLIISSSIMYFVESETQPEVFSSIPASMWWGVCTLTTVGYGDMYPVTTLGKLMASVMSILGIGMFALPAGILAGGFEKALSVEEQQEEKTQKSYCPYCGEKLEK